MPKLAQVATSLNITLKTPKVILNKKIPLSIHVQVPIEYTLSLPDYNSSQDKQSHVPLQTASAIFVCGKMTKRVYTEIRLLLKEAGADVLPTYENLDTFRKEHRPDVKELPTSVHRCQLWLRAIIEIDNSSALNDN